MCIGVDPTKNEVEKSNSQRKQVKKGQSTFSRSKNVRTLIGVSRGVLSPVRGLLNYLLCLSACPTKTTKGIRLEAQSSVADNTTAPFPYHLIPCPN